MNTIRRHLNLALAISAVSMSSIVHGAGTVVPGESGGASFSPTVVQGLTNSIGGFFGSSTPDLMTLNPTLSSLKGVDLSDPKTREALAPVFAAVQLQAQQVQALAAAALDSPVNTVVANKLIALDMLTSFQLPETQSQVAKLSRAYYDALPKGQKEQIRGKLLMLKMESMAEALGRTSEVAVAPADGVDASKPLSATGHRNQPKDWQLQLNPETVLMAIPVGTEKSFTAKAWAQSFEAAKKKLIKSLHPAKWAPVADEGLMGTMVENPYGLVGETITGIDRSNDSVTIFAGTVRKIKNISAPNGRPWFEAELDGPSGRQVVNIPGAHELHILKSFSRERVATGNPEIDGLAFIGTQKFFTAKDWVEARRAAEKKLDTNLTSSEWISLGQKGLLGTRVDNPEALVGEVIIGVNQGEDSQNGATVTIFAGKVLSVKNESDDGRPLLTAEISGPYGKQHVSISGAHGLRYLLSP